MEILINFRYVCKDGEYIVGPESNIAAKKKVKEWVEGKPTKVDQAMQLIRDGGTVEDVMMVLPSVWLMRKNQLEEYAQEWRRIQSRNQKIKWNTGELFGALLEESDAVAPSTPIIGWLLSNINVNRKLRQKQLYMHGPPGVGKTTLIRLLTMCVNRCFIMPDDDKFEDYTNDVDLVIWDEPSGKSLAFLNKFLDGQMMTLPGRYKQTVKTNNPAVVISSNESPYILYEKAVSEGNRRFPAFISRLVIVEVGGDEVKTIVNVLLKLLGIDKDEFFGR